MHKPFAVVGRFFDYLIEPTLFEAGFDAIDEQLHIVYANILYRRGPAACGAARWERLLAAFVAACRRPSHQTLSALAEANAACAIEANDEIVQRLLTLVPPDAAGISERIVLDQGHGIGMRDLLDPAATSLIENCITWPERLGRIIVLHDESNVVARWREKLAVLASPDAIDEVGEYWAARMPYPLAIDEIRLGDSAASACLQLADVLAGASVTWLSQFVGAPNQDGDFVTALTEAGIGELIENPVWPVPLVPDAPY